MTSDHDPLHDRLRASLSRHAADAPPAEPLAERIVLAAGRPQPAARRPRRWPTWTLPLVTAGVVGAVVLAVVGIENYHPTSHKATPAQSGSATRRVMPPVLPATTGPTTPSATATSAVPAAALKNVTILDLTFAGPDDGWALASANCVRGPGRCTALLRTTDGRTWRSMPGAAFNVAGVKGCAAPCVQDIRFANDRIGYAFGPDALFMTTNGGASWHAQPGGADALETLDGNVIRLVSDHSGCPGPCNLRVETAPIGSTTWTAHKLPGGPVDAGTVTLVRSGRYAVVQTSSGSAGGAGPRATLYLSADDGQTWRSRPDPCMNAGSTTSVAPAGDGSISFLCESGGGTGSARTMTSTDGGRTFTVGRVHHFGAPGTLMAASSRVLVVVTDRPVRSTDAGRTWRPGDVTFTGNGDGGFAGFESTTVGRVVAPGGHTIWTTRDAGASWKPVTFG